MKTALVDLQIRLAAPTVDVSVEVRLRSFGTRWLAVAETDGAPVTGLGPTAGAALHASLGTLKDSVRRALLADLSLLEPARPSFERRGRSVSSTVGSPRVETAR